jgi:hypothetical protein
MFVFIVIANKIEHYTFNCHLLNVLGYHQVHYTAYIEKNTGVGTD